MQNPENFDEFEIKYSHINDFIKKIIASKQKICIVKAPVKSGKRWMVIGQALRGMSPMKEKEKHIYLTSLNRIDITTQLKEYHQYGVEAFISKGKEDIENVINRIKKIISKNTKVICHIDESDYGSGNKQLLKTCFDFLVGEANCKRIVLYSATNEEVLLSKFNQTENVFEYIPPQNYHGANWFLKEKLVHEPSPFYNLELDTLTQEGNLLIHKLKNENKLFGVVRFSPAEYNRIKKSKFRDLINEQGIRVEYIDSENSFSWETDYRNFNGKTLLVVCQTCTRSTEVKFHDKILFWHDYRKESSTYATLSQAFLRVAHYEKNNQSGLGYEPNSTKILCYMLPEVFELAANKISYNDWDNLTKRKLTTRVSEENRKKYKVLFANAYKDIPLDIRQKQESQIGGKYGKISSNKKTDLAKNIAAAKLAGQRTHIVYIDKANEMFIESWELIKQYAGKWAYYIEHVEEKQFTTNKKSMYN